MDRSPAVATSPKHDSPANACFLPHVIGTVDAILNRYFIGDDTKQNTSTDRATRLFSLDSALVQPISSAIGCVQHERHPNGLSYVPNHSRKVHAC